MKNKLFLTTAVVAGLLLTTRIVLYDGLSVVTVVSAIVGVILLSMLFHLGEFKLLRKTGPPLFPVLDLRANERVVFQSGASYLRRLKTIDGQLTLTNQRLVFHADRLDVPAREEIIYVADIDSVSQGDGAEKNILEIKLESDQAFRFSVASPSRWARALLGAMAARRC